MEPTSILSILSTVIGGVVAIIGRYLLHRVKKIEENQDIYSEAITKLENTAVTDSHVRAVVKEEIQPLAYSINRVADSMDVIKEYIAEDKGFKAGQAAALRRKDDSQ